MLCSARITAVLFDLDDTLIDWSGRLHNFADTARPHINNLYDCLTAAGHTLPERETLFQQYNEAVVQGWEKAKKNWSGVNFGRVLINTFIRIGLDVTRIDLDAAMQAYDWQPIPGVRPYADTHTVLQALKDSGYKIGLITNSMYPMWMRDVELQAYNMLDYFDARVTSGDTGYMKPHPAIYRRALKMMDAAPESSVFVGDRPANDIAGANNTGMISVWMNPPHIEFDLNNIKPDYTITALSELLPILEKLETEK